MKYVIAVAVVLALFTFLPQKGPQMQPLEKENAILAFGDSLTHGFGAPPQESYPVQLQQLSGLRVINAGVNGETSSEGLRRLSSSLEDPSVKLMILCMGGNDILQKKPMAALKANLVEMVRLAKAKGVDVLLVSVPDLSLFGLSPPDIYQEVADKEGVPLLEGILSEILGNPALKSDQIHPNAKGYALMAQKIFEALQIHGWLPPSP